MEPQPHKTHFTHTHHTTHTQTQTHKMFAKMISSIVSFWVPFAGPVLTLLGWKLCFLLVGVCMATYGLKQVDAEQLSWLGGKTKVFETQQQRVNEAHDEAAPAEAEAQERPAKKSRCEILAEML